MVSLTAKVLHAAATIPLSDLMRMMSEKKMKIPPETTCDSPTLTRRQPQGWSYPLGVSKEVGVSARIGVYDQVGMPQQQIVGVQ